MTMITPSYLGETIEYSSLHACRSTLEDPTNFAMSHAGYPWNQHVHERARLALRLEHLPISRNHGFPHRPLHGLRRYIIPDWRPSRRGKIVLVGTQSPAGCGQCEEDGRP